MAARLRIVHYLNQFFGGIGGEEKASVVPQVKVGSFGTGKVVNQVLKERGELVATIICGDNYFVEEMDKAIQEVTQLLAPYRPDLVIAGPAFNAGRYGVACGALCKAIQEKLGVSTVTGMYEKNPGVGLYKKDVYIVKTTDSITGLTEAVSKMVNLGLKLVSNQEIGRPDEEGYIPRGILKRELSDMTAAQRAVNMLLAKLQGEAFEAELHLREFECVKPAVAVEALSSAKIALVTDGGLVPKGNPDSIERFKATKYGKYSVKGTSKLNPEDYEVVHLGYDNLAVGQDPHRLVPLDVMRDLEKERIFGELCESLYSTTGVLTTLENSRRMGQSIAKQLKDERVDGVILTST